LGLAELSLSDPAVAQPDVDINCQDNDGITPLSEAARNGKEAVVKLLLAQADMNANGKDENGQTPILRAARAGYEARCCSRGPTST
jgi:ankyrin repeat protein